MISIMLPVSKYYWLDIHIQRRHFMEAQTNMQQRYYLRVGSKIRKEDNFGK
jgi:hypothetical protein